MCPQPIGILLTSSASVLSCLVRPLSLSLSVRVRSLRGSLAPLSFRAAVYVRTSVPFFFLLFCCISVLLFFCSRVLRLIFVITFSCSSVLLPLVSLLVCSSFPMFLFLFLLCFLHFPVLCPPSCPSSVLSFSLSSGSRVVFLSVPLLSILLSILSRCFFSLLSSYFPFFSRLFFGSSVLLFCLLLSSRVICLSTRLLYVLLSILLSRCFLRPYIRLLRRSPTPSFALSVCLSSVFLHQLSPALSVLLFRCSIGCPFTYFTFTSLSSLRCPDVSHYSSSLFLLRHRKYQFSEHLFYPPRFVSSCPVTTFRSDKLKKSSCVTFISHRLFLPSSCFVIEYQFSEQHPLFILLISSCLATSFRSNRLKTSCVTCCITPPLLSFLVFRYVKFQFQERHPLFILPFSSCPATFFPSDKLKKNCVTYFSPPLPSFLLLRYIKQPVL